MPVQTQPGQVRRAGLIHKIGCPVDLLIGTEEEVAALLARVETYREVRPARLANQDGIQYPVPPERLLVTHCQQCGELSYERE